MWLRKKGKEEGLKKEIRKEAERFRKLLQAYELLVSEGKVLQGVLEQTQRIKEMAKVMISIPDDYQAAQTALTILWDAYEAAESGKMMDLDSITSWEQLLTRARVLDRVRCFNCLDIYDSNYGKCPGCGAER